MCTTQQHKRFLTVYRRKFQALVRYINPADAHFAAVKTAEIQTCVNRTEIPEIL